MPTEAVRVRQWRSAKGFVNTTPLQAAIRTQVKRAQVKDLTPDEFLLAFQPARRIPVELRWADDHFELDGLQAGTVVTSSPDVQAWVRF